STPGRGRTYRRWFGPGKAREIGNASALLIEGRIDRLKSQRRRRSMFVRRAVRRLVSRLGVQLSSPANSGPHSAHFSVAPETGRRFRTPRAVVTCPADQLHVTTRRSLPVAASGG